MGFSAALLALSAVKGITSIGQGYAQAGESDYNASLATQQGQLIGVQGGITQGQYTRQAGQVLASSTASVAAKGLQPTGSAAAVMLDTQTQIHTDMAIAQFNTQMGQNRANSEAALLKQKAKNSIFSGYSNAFSDVLTGAANYGMYNNKASWNLSAGANGFSKPPYR